MSENPELRRVQAYSGERSFTVVIPKSIAGKLGIEKGDFLKCYIENEKLIVEKVKI